MQKFKWGFNSDVFESVGLPDSIDILIISTLLDHEHGFVFHGIIFHSVDITFLYIMSS